MNKLIAAAVITVFSAGMAMAAGPETMTLPAKMGNVTFHHKQHQERLKDCKLCHKAGPGKIQGFGKEWAHKTCKGCHESKGAGPTKCPDCHKKK
jgi:flavoprotein